MDSALAALDLMDWSAAPRSPGSIGRVSYDPKIRMHRCDSCDRVMNSGVDLVEMRKPGVIEPMMICCAGGCWDKANARGYLSRVQRQQASDGGSDPT